jgi:ABC-type bacteriocin/lantibiotic exporter with double-glycine peptidase domain
MDEATSALDAECEKDVSLAMKKLNIFNRIANQMAAVD